MTIYVSNLSFTVSDDRLKKIFAPFGEVASAKVMTGNFTNQSRGLPFCGNAGRTTGTESH